MSLIKEYNTYNDRPILVDKLIHKFHNEYEDAKRDMQVSCPLCQSSKYSFAFDKYSFHYLQCNDCMSLYIQNILQKDEISKYEHSLEQEVYGTEEYKNYLEFLSNKISFDLELTFSRLFAKKQGLNVAYYGNKGMVYKTGLKKFNIKSFDCLGASKKSHYDLIIVDHYIEKSQDLNSFIKEMKSLLADDGFLYITIRVGSGIDILTLWEDSKIYPIEHNVLCSVDGIKSLLNNNYFNIKELNTPGVLDVNNILKTESRNIPRFLTYLKGSDNSNLIDEFQIFIQKNLLSSFAIVIATKD